MPIFAEIEFPRGPTLIRDQELQGATLAGKAQSLELLAMLRRQMQDTEDQCYAQQFPGGWHVYATGSQSFEDEIFRLLLEDTVELLEMDPGFKFSLIYWYKDP